jgi:hypothetical protein
MAATVSWRPNPELDVASYNVYKSINQTVAGPYNLVGNVAHNPLVSLLSFVDPSGTLNDYYKLTTLNLDSIESLASNAFKPFSQSDMTRLYDTIFDASRRPVTGLQVKATLDVPQASFNDIVVPKEVITYTDANGVWFMDLFPNASLTPSGTQYIITIQNVNPPQTLTLPAAPAVQYSSLVTP